MKYISMFIAGLAIFFNIVLVVIGLMVLIMVIRYVYVAATAKRPRPAQERREYWRKKIEEDKCKKTLKK